MAAVVVAGLLAGSGFGGIRLWRNALRQPGPLTAGRDLVVPRGGTDQLARVLTREGVIRYRWVFSAAVWLTREDGPLHAAELAFPAHASIAQVIDILRHAKPVEHQLTIAEGLTARQIEVLLDHADAMVGAVKPIAEGAMLPQTYDYVYGATRESLVARASAAMTKALDAAWANRAPNLPLASPHDALVLASIVERETAKPDERPHIAAVYLNRLRLGMRLQADPTVIYFASHGTGVLDHGLTKAELAQDDPFNTYRNPGLPPTPICSPGLESLEAVLHPSDSDDLYFVADGTGGHVFSRSYRAHDAAVARWRALVPSASHGRAE